VRRRRDKELTLDQQIMNLEERLELYAALETVLADPHDLLEVMLASTDPDAAVPALRSRFGISEIAARAVLDAQFRRVTSRERALITEGCDELRAHLETLRRQVADTQP
jgi:DNA gyrase subunit A